MAGNPYFTTKRVAGVTLQRVLPRAELRQRHLLVDHLSLSGASHDAAHGPAPSR